LKSPPETGAASNSGAGDHGRPVKRSMTGIPSSRGGAFILAGLVEVEGDGAAGGVCPRRDVGVHGIGAETVARAQRIREGQGEGAVGGLVPRIEGMCSKEEQARRLAAGADRREPHREDEPQVGVVVGEIDQKRRRGVESEVPGAVEDVEVGVAGDLEASDSVIGQSARLPHPAAAGVMSLPAPCRHFRPTMMKRDA